MPANLVLALTPLAATIKHRGSGKTSWGLFRPQITGLSPHLIVRPSQCRSVFCAQVLEMPGFGRDDGRAKLNVAELCWQMHGSHRSLRQPPARQPPSHKRRVTVRDKCSYGREFQVVELAMFLLRKTTRVLNIFRGLIFTSSNICVAINELPQRQNIN